MSPDFSFRIAVFAGDGIGPEVMELCVKVLARAVELSGAAGLDFQRLDGGAAHYQLSGVALPNESIRDAERSDAILFGAMGLPHVRYSDGREIAPQLDLREMFQLFAGVRPVRPLRGVPRVLSDARALDIDFVLVRESTEGMFAQRLAGRVDKDEVATDTMRITRSATKRVSEFAFSLAARRGKAGRGKVTCVDKANVLASLAFFRKVFDEVAASRCEVDAEHMYVDAAALNLVRNPWSFDVIVTENLFGDILSDLGAALLGGMGMAPSSDIGEQHAIFQPCHGSAPDITGKGVANPIGMILSGAMMLDWLGARYAEPATVDCARLITNAIDVGFQKGLISPIEIGGQDGSGEVTAKVIAEIEQLARKS